MDKEAICSIFVKHQSFFFNFCWSGLHRQDGLRKRGQNDEREVEAIVTNLVVHGGDAAMQYKQLGACLGKV